MASPLANSIQFLIDFGFFDVILPFILVFTISFAIFEKTKVFGTKDEQMKRNINAMVSFVIALVVVATPKIIGVIQVSLPQVALFLIVIIAFMMLAGSFMSGDKEFSFKDTGWGGFLTFVVFFGVLAIFLNALDWLEGIIDYVKFYWTDTLIVSLIFLAIVVGVIMYVVKDPKKGEIANG
jgi:hypothetical protein